MIRYKQHQPFIVLEFEGNSWDYTEHNHNYFEIIIISKGSGKHTINGISFEYKESDIFLMAPEDIHAFEVVEYSVFYYFKFTEHLFASNEKMQVHSNWLQKVEPILANPNILPGPINFKEEDKLRMLNLANIVLDEHHYTQCYSSEIISDTIRIMVSLIARNICNNYRDRQIKIPKNTDNISNILTYIRHNVYDLEKMRIESLALFFNMSKNYISIFFKKHTGEALQQYIINYRLTLVENRIKHSNYTITEIAYQLGYTDISHLNKLFKKKYGKSPREFKFKTKIKDLA